VGVRGGGLYKLNSLERCVLSKCVRIPADYLCAHSFQAPAFNPGAYKVKTWFPKFDFQNLISNANLYRYSAGVPTKGFAAATVLLRSGWCTRVDFYGQPVGLYNYC
jgi:hypothetical protein